MTERKTYSKEFKQEAVRLAEANGNLSQTARDLGIHKSMLGKQRRHRRHSLTRCPWNWGKTRYYTSRLYSITSTSMPR